MVYFRDIEIGFYVNCSLNYLEVLLGDKAVRLNILFNYFAVLQFQIFF